MSKEKKISDETYMAAARAWLPKALLRAMAKEGLAEKDVLWIGTHDGSIGMPFKDYLLEAGKAVHGKMGEWDHQRYIPCDTFMIGDGWWIDAGAYPDNGYHVIRPATIGSSNARRPANVVTRSNAATLQSINETKEAKVQRLAKAKVEKLQKELAAAKAALK